MFVENNMSFYFKLLNADKSQPLQMALYVEITQHSQTNCIFTAAMDLYWADRL